MLAPFTVAKSLQNVRATAGVPHQFLGDLDIHTEPPEIRRQRMTKTVPADLLVDDSIPRECGSNAPLQNAVGA